MKAQPTIICLMGPTASGKTALAVSLVQEFPCEIISVDSAMVYKTMDIGTAKPDAETLKNAPHHLIDLVDPSVPYSAGQFRTDALHAINDIIQRGKIPLLVGGTMMYFRILHQGMANLPRADANIRAQLQARAEKEGWVALHAELRQIDSEAAKRINEQDGQRIQRALEVYLLTGQPISHWQTHETSPLSGYQVHHLAIAPTERAELHERIAHRFQQMLDVGFIAEATKLYERGDLTPDLPSMRTVGYRQAWQYLAGEINYEEMRAQAIAATRQLAKRQLTWLRSWPDVVWFEGASAALHDKVFAWIRETGYPMK